MKFLAQNISRITAAQLLMLSSFSLWPTAVLASDFCKPYWYTDGDTFYYRNSLGEQVRVRVAGFDAPERGQPFSRKATDKMKSLPPKEPTAIATSPTVTGGRFVPFTP